MVRSVSLIVLYIFAKRFVLSVSGFLSQRNFCTTAVLLWGTHWGAVSWIVLFFSCRAIPRAKRRQRSEIRPTAVLGEDLEVGQNVVWERPCRDRSGSEYDAGRLTEEENGE